MPPNKRPSVSNGRAVANNKRPSVTNKRPIVTMDLREPLAKDQVAEKCPGGLDRGERPGLYKQRGRMKGVTVIQGQPRGHNL